MKRSLTYLVILACSLMSLCGCITTRNGSNAGNEFPAQSSLKSKKVAILPVKSQAGITTDSHTPLKKVLNAKINKAVKAKLPDATITGSQDSVDALNDAGKLEVVEKLMSGYEQTGAFDKKLLSALSSTLKTDYLLVSKLKLEQMNAVVAKTFVASLEVMLIAKNGSEPVWSGIGDFKRFGAYGLGGTETEEAAQELVDLAFGKPETAAAQ